jgi:hypothetical protein
VQDLEHATGDHGGANDSRIGYGDCDRIDPGNNNNNDRVPTRGVGAKLLSSVGCVVRLSQLAS